MPSHQFDKLSVGNKDSEFRWCVYRGLLSFIKMKVCGFKDYPSVKKHIQRNKMREGEEEQRRQGWVGRRNNKNANDLRSGRSDKVIKTGYTNKKVTRW